MYQLKALRPINSKASRADAAYRPRHAFKAHQKYVTMTMDAYFSPSLFQASPALPCRIADAHFYAMLSRHNF